MADFAKMTVAEFDFYCLVVYRRLNPSSPWFPRKSMDDIVREAREKGRPLMLHICNGDAP